MLHTTFRKAREAGACVSSYRKFAKAVGGVKKYGLDTPIGLDKILEICGFEDALWCLQITIEDCEREIRLFACDCAEHVLPIYEKKFPKDHRPRKAIEVSRRFADGLATREELATAVDAAGDAARAAWFASMAAWFAARDAWVAGDAVDAARDAAWDAWFAARDAWVDGDAAWDAEREWREKRFRELLNENWLVLC